MYSNKYEFDFAYDWLTNKQYLKYHIAAQKNPNLHLDKDDQFLSYLESTVFPFIDVDEINTKYDVLLAEIEKNGGDKSSIRTKINDSSSNRNMESR